ncbi:MAG: pyruvate formate lyase family protein [Sphaerochaetaceae bacterium]
MKQHIVKLREFYVEKKEHHAYRQKGVDPFYLAKEFAKRGLDDVQRAHERLKWVLEQEKPLVFKDEKIALLRTVPTIPEIYTENEWDALKRSYRIHEQGKVSNICPGYATLINKGFDVVKDEIKTSIAQNRATKERAYLDTLLNTLTLLEEFGHRYRVAAVEAGNAVVAESFAQIPQKPPQTLLQALQFFRLLHYGLWASFNYHNTIGRFDQYMYPYYARDMADGTLDEESALELLQEFFITFNKDSDLYPGMQQGDNGQSLMLGGLNSDGSDAFNELSRLCMLASLELKLIDPKINLRVHKKTSMEVLELGSQMTKQGLGFPQYSNDEVVIKALKQWGYAQEDAYNYVVAACWEFIIPEVAMDIVNIDALSFLKAVLDALSALARCNTYAEFSEVVKNKLCQQTSEICANTNGIYMEKAPLMSLMMKGCVEQARDISLGSRYNNYGIHGTGLSSAADSLAAIKKYIFEEQSITKETLIAALKADFVGSETLYHKLRFEGPKMGNDDDYVDEIATELLDWFADSLEGNRNDRGGIFRAGTGSAMFYLWHGSALGASPDGRRRGEEFACNFSPALHTHLKGPISLIKSFSKANLTRVANGGPLTIELDDSMFRNTESTAKVALLVKSYMDLGGMQIQLNGVNREMMLDAQKNPDKYRNLIVRVWGWSGYFVELDKAYQDHIIKRSELDF